MKKKLHSGCNIKPLLLSIILLLFSFSISATTTSNISSLSSESPFGIIYTPVVPKLDNLSANNKLIKLLANTFNDVDMHTFLNDDEKIKTFKQEIFKVSYKNSSSFNELTDKQKGQLNYFRGNIEAYLANGSNYNSHFIRNAQNFYKSAYKDFEKENGEEGMATALIAYARINVFPTIEPPTEQLALESDLLQHGMLTYVLIKEGIEL